MDMANLGTSPVVGGLDTAWAGGEPDGYLGIQDLQSALANPNFDWGQGAHAKKSAMLVLDIFRAGDTEVLQALGFFQSPDGQWLLDVRRHDFEDLFSAARAQPLPLGALDARTGVDQHFDVDDLKAELFGGGFNSGSPLSRAYAQYLIARADANDAAALQAEGFYFDGSGYWTAQVERFSYLGTHAYTGTTLTDDMLDQVWSQGYADVHNPMTDADHARAMTLFFEHLHNDLHMDVGRLGCNWRALEPTRGVVDPAVANRLRATLQAASDAGVKIILGVGAKSASDAGQFRDVPSWANNGVEVGDPAGLLVEGRAQMADSAFGQDVLGFVGHIMQIVGSLPEVVRANIVGYQIENEPLNEWGLGYIDPSLLSAEAQAVRGAAPPGVPLVINHWSSPDHDAIPQALQQAAEFGDFVGFDIYAAGASGDTPWYASDEQQWGLPRQYQNGIVRADGSIAGTFIAELQASTWVNSRSEGFIATAESVQPLIDQANALDMNVLFWRLEDLEVINPNSRSYVSAEVSAWQEWAAQGLSQAEAQLGLSKREAVVLDGAVNSYGGNWEDL